MDLRPSPLVSGVPALSDLVYMQDRLIANRTFQAKMKSPQEKESRSFVIQQYRAKNLSELSFQQPIPIPEVKVSRMFSLTGGGRGKPLNLSSKVRKHTLFPQKKQPVDLGSFGFSNSAL